MTKVDRAQCRQLDDVVVVAWCRYAMLGHEPGAMLLLAVARQALLQLDNFSPQELTNMVHPLLCSPQCLLIQLQP